jgi:hypothetical protein
MKSKWSLLVTTIPYVAVILLIKIVLTNIFGYSGWIKFSDVALVLTGGIFLTGFMLAGTMADFKESEKLPGELACLFESAEETFTSISQTCKSNIEVLPSLEQLLSSILIFRKWLVKEVTQEEMYNGLTKLSQRIIEIEKAGANGGACGKIYGDVHSIRKIATRMAVISRTGFLATGYALLEVLISCIILILLISNFQSEYAEKILVFFVSMIYIYMYRLIKDIDDPFEYNVEGAAGAAEIPLFPIDEYLERLIKKIEKLKLDQP